MTLKIKERTVFAVRPVHGKKGGEKALNFMKKGVCPENTGKGPDLYDTANRSGRAHFLFAAYSEKNDLLGVCSISLHTGGIIWLNMLVVDKKYKRQGIATGMLRYLLSDYAVKNSVHKLQCDSSVDNKDARKFLKKSGFRKVGKMRRHWGKQDYYLWEYLT